jgi:Mg2+-importing ATPase
MLDAIPTSGVFMIHLFIFMRNKLLYFFDNAFSKRKQFIGSPNLLDENYSIKSSVESDIVKNRLIDASYSRETDLINKLNSSLIGLSTLQVEQNQNLYGLNEIERHEDLTWWRHLWLCYKNPFNLLLTLLDIFFIITNDMRGMVVISSMIIISTVLRFVQERKSNAAADKLKDMVSTTATVIRYDNALSSIELSLENIVKLQDIHNQYKQEVPIKDLVPGDIIRLSAGDLIPADVRILNAKDLFVSQASLTGESLPIEKFSIQSKSNIINPLYLDNIGYMGTNVISGSAIAVVISTGLDTIFGNLANRVTEVNKEDTSFQLGINRVSLLLIGFMLIMSPIVFILNGYTKHDWMSAFIFAMSIAVGLTPEMLPMIVTSTLAKGAVAMSRRKVIIKRLDAIQNFGAMNILCTDKTGTLTQDKICLERHIDIMGENCDEVLEFAYLNSYYQTGLKNLLDVAVLEKANFGDIPELIKKYKKVDEVPFDFQRRRMSVVVENDNKGHTLICKGAFEEIISCCSTAIKNNKIEPLTEDLLFRLKNITANLNQDGLRVVAVAIKQYTDIKESYNIADESSMVLVGYIAFMDPPKETTKPAIDALRKNGVRVKILTGDNELVTKKVCSDVGLDVEGMLLGSDIDTMSDKDLASKIEKITVFAKLTPSHKDRIVRLLKSLGHTVGFMGDGINDAPALRSADIGISVDSAVDIAKEAADIILLEKSLMVLEDGVEEGRKTFANMLKYIKITASSNFGNVFSVLVASAFLPFEPMLPMHLLVLNLLYDISQIVIPFDNVDREFILKPQNWDAKELRRFIVFFGPLSSIFDITTFILLWYFYGANSPTHATFFQSGWFVESLFTQTMIVHMIRTRKIPFIQSNASISMVIMMVIILSIGVLIPMTPITATYFKMQSLPISYFIWLIITVISYLLLTQFMKNIYTKKYGWN